MNPTCDSEGFFPYFKDCAKRRVTLHWKKGINILEMFVTHVEFMHICMCINITTGVKRTVNNFTTSFPIKTCLFLQVKVYQ